MITKLVGVRIKELRGETGLSQESFANKINMARTYFAEVETGKRNVSIRNLLKITNGLGVTLEKFFDSELFEIAYRKEGDPPTQDVQPMRIHYAYISLPPER